MIEGTLVNLRAPEMGDLVKSRLAQWDLLPPPLQQEFLANEKTLHYLAGIGFIAIGIWTLIKA